VDYIDPKVLDDYREHQFIFYDNVIPYKDTTEIFQTLQTTMAANTNIAFVSRSESGPADWKKNNDTALQADLDPVSLGELSVSQADVNTLKLTAHLNNSQFLVINDNYNTQWHALINGRQARLLRANFAFKGLWVPAGDSNIVLHFSNPKRYMLHFGLMVLFGGVFLYLLVLLKKEQR
jgi:uncharacterized membrane protein YfhO